MALSPTFFYSSIAFLPLTLYYTVFSDRRDTGGVLILIRKSSFPSFVIDASQVLVPGRVLKVSLRHTSGCPFNIWNIHYYQFTSEQFNAVSNSIDTNVHTAHANRLQFFSVIGGDFNIHRDDSIKFNLASPASPPLFPLVPPPPVETLKIVLKHCYHLLTKSSSRNRRVFTPRQKPNQ